MSTSIEATIGNDETRERGVGAYWPSLIAPVHDFPIRRPQVQQPDSLMYESVPALKTLDADSHLARLIHEYREGLEEDKGLPVENKIRVLEKRTELIPGDIEFNPKENPGFQYKLAGRLSSIMSVAIPKFQEFIDNIANCIPERVNQRHFTLDPAGEILNALLIGSADPEMIATYWSILQQRIARGKNFIGKYISEYQFGHTALIPFSPASTTMEIINDHASLSKPVDKIASWMSSIHFDGTGESKPSEEAIRAIKMGRWTFNNGTSIFSEGVHAAIGLAKSVMKGKSVDRSPQGLIEEAKKMKVPGAPEVPPKPIFYASSITGGTGLGRETQGEKVVRKAPWDTPLSQMEFTTAYQSTPYETGASVERSFHWNEGSSLSWYAGHNYEKKILTPIATVGGPGSQIQPAPSVHFAPLPESARKEWAEGGPSSVSQQWEYQGQRGNEEDVQAKEATKASSSIPEEANPFSVNFKKGVSIGSSHIGLSQTQPLVGNPGPSRLPGYFTATTGGQSSGQMPAVPPRYPGVVRGYPGWPGGTGGGGGNPNPGGPGGGGANLNPNPGGNLNPGGPGGGGGNPNLNPGGNPNWPGGPRGPPGNNGNPGGPGGPPGNPGLGGPPGNLNPGGPIGPRRPLPAIKNDIKAEEVPKWDVNEYTAVEYFHKVQELAEVGGYIPEDLGTWLWKGFPEGSCILKWYRSRTSAEKA
ncbi:hypothetical protein C8J56DRAFT_1049560 [Mycena floridula]|nr:hypothetical protein C8J56DRAFT_1049560 [Mycena floridula]